LRAQRRGPFLEADFAALPETHWTLLVNGVDRAVPQVADELLPLFSFLPRCRCQQLRDARLRVSFQVAVLIM
jgi:50S ribosomal protein L16 3-hydroxylase